MKITEEVIRQIKDKIITGYAPEKIILFGSYAYGEPEKGSDLDIFIIKETDVPHHKRIQEVYETLRGCFLPMDIIVCTPQEVEKYKDIIGTIIYPVMKKGKVIYDKTGNNK